MLISGSLISFQWWAGSPKFPRGQIEIMVIHNAWILYDSIYDKQQQAKHITSSTEKIHREDECPFGGWDGSDLMNRCTGCLELSPAPASPPLFEAKVLQQRLQPLSLNPAQISHLPLPFCILDHSGRIRV